MATRSQLRLLQSILALGKNSLAGKTVPGERCAFYSISNSPGAILANSLSTPFRHFTTSSAFWKKIKGPKDAPVPDNASEKGRRSEIDPYDYTELESGISKALGRLKEALTKTRSAGRISPETIENLPVQLNIKHDPGASGKDHKESGRLGDYATVVPKGGRVMQVFVAEESVRLCTSPIRASQSMLTPTFFLQHLKPISSAILSSPHSLVPVPDAQNPLLLNIPVPPPTAESRAQAAAEAKKSMERASLEVRTARGDAQKRYRKMELGKKVIVDELRKGHEGMEKVAQKAQEEVKKVYEQAIKGLER
jgi:ribosome recycling factor